MQAPHVAAGAPSQPAPWAAAGGALAVAFLVLAAFAWFWVARDGTFVGAIFLVNQCAQLLDGQKILADATWVCESLLSPMLMDVVTTEVSLATYKRYAVGVLIVCVFAFSALVYAAVRDVILAAAAVLGTHAVFTLNWWVGYADPVTMVMLAGLYLSLLRGWRWAGFAFGLAAGVTHAPAAFFGLCVISIVLLRPRWSDVILASLALGGLVLGAAFVSVYLLSTHGPGVSRASYVLQGVAATTWGGLMAFPAAYLASPLRLWTMALIGWSWRMQLRILAAFALVLVTGLLALDQSRIMSVVGFPLALHLAAQWRTHPWFGRWPWAVRSGVLAVAVLVSVAGPAGHVWEARYYGEHPFTTVILDDVFPGWAGRDQPSITPWP